MALDDRHALYCAWVLALARRHGLDCRPVLEAGEYTDLIEVMLAAEPRPDGAPAVTLVLVVPPPPDDWIAPPF